MANGDWYTVMALRRIYLFDIQINKPFNIETLSGMKFDKPQISIGFRRLIAKTYLWDANIEVVGTYPNYTIKYDTTTIEPTSTVQVLFLESDY